MPIVKMRPVRKLEAYQRYNAKDRGELILESAPEGLEGQQAQAIRDEHERFKNKQIEHLAHTIYQSWHPKESKLFSPEKYNEMGRELAERFAPGHLAWVVTHTDKDHIHNHIVICSVHSETGKVLKRKKDDFKRLHEINNEIARESGLSLNKARVNDPYAKLPDNVRKLVSMGKNSWLLDMVNKIDFARTASTSFDEFVGTLGELGVQARVENKNISYAYGDKKPWRGKSLGTSFDKEGLIKAFKENDEKFAKQPGLRGQILGDIRAAFDGKGNPVGAPSALLLESASHRDLGKKDYGAYTKVDRRADSGKLPPALGDPHGILHPEMKKAKSVSLFDYCQENNIQTKVNERGQTVLRGREFVVLGENEWTNTKNHTKGGIVEFVAIHDETNYVRALAKINKNPRLLLLESVIGDTTSSYQPFYIPRPKAIEPQGGAQKALSRLLASRHVQAKAADVLLKSQRLHAGKDGSVWLMGEGQESAMEYKEEPGGAWRGKRHGKPTGAFLELIRPGKQLAVYPDPFSYAHAMASGAHAPKPGGSVLVLFGGDSARKMEEILALHPHIKEAHIAPSASAQERTFGPGDVHEMNKRFRPFGIELAEHSASHEGKAKGRGPDIGF